MPAKIIDGKEISNNILDTLKEKTKNLKEKPCLAIILVGNNPASEIYVSSKLKKAKDIGFRFKKFRLKEDVSQDELFKIIDNFCFNKVNYKIFQINTQMLITPKYSFFRLVTSERHPNYPHHRIKELA